MRLAICLEYDGTNYFGWQKQENVPSVQAQVEKALAKVAAHPIEVICAGRTDAGVHATGQIIHFDTEVLRDPRAWVFGVNSYLPPDIRVRWVKQVSPDFHARYSAISRSYKYSIYNSRVRSALLRNQTACVYPELDVLKMQEAANYLLGEHDFSSFRGSGCQSKSVFRNVKSINVSREGLIVSVTICANAFLLHMVRNIVGLLIEIGANKHAPDWAGQVLLARDRKKSAKTAPPQGLCLVAVEYATFF